MASVVKQSRATQQALDTKRMGGQYVGVPQARSFLSLPVSGSLICSHDQPSVTARMCGRRNPQHTASQSPYSARQQNTLATSRVPWAAVFWQSVAPRSHPWEHSCRKKHHRILGSGAASRCTRRAVHIPALGNCSHPHHSPICPCLRHLGPPRRLRCHRRCYCFPPALSPRQFSRLRCQRRRGRSRSLPSRRAVQPRLRCNQQAKPFSWSRGRRTAPRHVSCCSSASRSAKRQKRRYCES